MKTTFDLDESDLRQAILEWAEKHHSIKAGENETVDVGLPESLCSGLETGLQHVSIYRRPM